MSSLTTSFIAIELPSLARQTSDRTDLIDEQQPSLQTSAHLRPVCRQATCSCILASFLAASFIAITVLAMLLFKATVGIANKPTSTSDVRTTPGWTSYSSDSMSTATHTVRTSCGNLGRETKPTTVEPWPTCTSSACYAAANDMSDYVTFGAGADPCNDFYNYVCGRFEGHEDSSVELRGATAFQTLTDQMNSQLRDSLARNDDALQKLKSVRLARGFFATCINATSNDFAGKSANQKLIKDIKLMYGGWPLKDEKNGFRLERLAGLLKTNENLDTVIAASISINLRNVSEYAIVLDQPALGLDDAYLLQPDRFPAQVAEYKRAMRVAAATLTRNASNGSSTEPLLHSDNGLDQEVEAVFNLETDLARLKVPESRIAGNHSLFYRATTLKDLLIDAKIQTSSQQLNWPEFLGGYFGDEVLAAMQNDSVDYSIVVQADSYFSGLQKLYKSGKYSNRNWHSYLIWRLVRSRVYMLDIDWSLANNTTSKVIAGDANQSSLSGESLIKLSGATASVVALDSDNCLDYAKYHFAWALTRLLTPSNQSELSVNSTRQTTMELELITDAILSAAAGIFTGIDWLDLPSKLNAERKQHGVVKHLMYPEWIFDNEKLDEFFDLPETGWKTVSFYDQITVLRRWRARKDKQKYLERNAPNRQQGEYYGGYTNVNAFYQQQENSITIPAPIVQPPFYRAGAPKAVNYGGIGFVIGHEISHGYDAEGVQYFDNGTLYLWLDRSSYAGFNKMDQCIIDEYNDYCYALKNGDSISHNKSALLCINGTFTQTENLALQIVQASGRRGLR